MPTLAAMTCSATIKKLTVTLLIGVITLSALAFPSASLAQRPRRYPPRPASRAGLDARVNQIAAAYLRGHYAFNPTEATVAGLHEHDSLLESRSREAVTRESRRLRGALLELQRINPALLSPEARYDYLVLQAHARAQLLELEDVRMWQRNPNVYIGLLAASVDNILKRNYAPTEQRLDAFVARARQIPRLLDEARANLANPPRIYTETAVAQARGSADFFARVVPQMIERAGGGRLSAARRAEINAAREAALLAAHAFAEWLERELLPRSHGQYAIGAENYRRKLLYEEMVETPIPQLLRDGERELRRTQEEMRALAEEIAPGRGIVEALRVLGRERPTGDGLVGETRAELDRIRAFVRERNILTPPARENLTVAETPAYARAFSFASMDTPGPFERVATEAYYYVTPPDPAWDARRREEHLSFFNRSALPIISMHEAFPGHYYQLLALSRSPSRVRAALGSASFVEGWAHYCEQMMLDEGYGGNNPKLRLAQLNLALLRLCRYLVGLRLHTQGMSYEEGVQFFMREGYQERVNAEREARRGTIDPTYLVYTLGKMEILRLRAEWQARMGDSFRLGEFHDRLLSFGMPPVRIIRLAMLGEAAANTSAASGAQDEASAVDFSVLAAGAMSGYEGARRVELITSADEWQRVWRVIGSGRPLPAVNFNTRAVVVAYQGQRPTGGYSITIAAIRREGQNIMVRVNEQRPEPGSITTQVITSPFVAVSIPRPPAGAVAQFAEARPANESRPVRQPVRRRAPPRRRPR